MVTQKPTQEEMLAATQRRQDFIASLPAAMLEAEDALPRAVETMNASSKSKLQKVYTVADQLSAARVRFVACGKGCASCCHMNISITDVEAERIGMAAKRQPTTVTRSVVHAAEKFSGVSCTFLDDQNVCTIYEHRPLSCRKHASFFKDPSTCHPSVMNDLQVPLVQFSGLDTALFVISERDGQVVVADIRDFFPRFGENL